MSDREPHPAPDTARDEIAEKCVYWSSSVVDARLRATFSESEVYYASVALLGLAPDPGCSAEADEIACRLMLAAIRASEGELAKLALWVEAGRADPRDLIAVAEYRSELVDGGSGGRDADLDGYLAWVRGEATDTA